MLHCKSIQYIATKNIEYTLNNNNNKMDIINYVESLYAYIISLKIIFVFQYQNVRYVTFRTPYVPDLSSIYSYLHTCLL